MPKTDPPAETPRPATPRRLWRLVRWPLAALAALALLVAGYAGSFWARYLRPATPLPAADASIGERHVAAGLPDRVARAAEARLLAARDGASLPAVSAAIGIGGELSWAQGLGFSDLERRQPVSLASRFRLGSTSKPLTGVLLGRLVDQGRIDLDAPIGGLLEELPDHLRAITPRQLASHTAGVRHYRPDLLSHPPHEAMPDERYESVSQALSIFADDPLLFEPGSGFGYTTYGFVLLSRALEAGGGADFPTLMAREVFAPAGMSETAAEDTGPPHVDEVGHYETGGGRYTRSFPIDNSGRWAGGGFVGSARDLVRLGNAVLSGALLSPRARALVFRPQPLAGGELNPQSYALGWRSHESVSLLGEQEPIPIVHHGGRQPGGAAFLLLVPRGAHLESDLVVAVLANSGAREARHEVQDVALELARLALRTLRAARASDPMRAAAAP